MLKLRKNKTNIIAEIIWKYIKYNLESIDKLSNDSVIYRYNNKGGGGYKKFSDFISIWGQTIFGEFKKHIGR